MRRFGFVFTISALAAALAGPARAEFSVCNQTFDVLNIAIGQYDVSSWETSGWWTIGPNQCANVITGDLRARYIYAYAIDVFGKAVLIGTSPMCVAPGRFKITGDKDCLIRGFVEAQFYEVDTLESERWTLFISPQPD